MNDVRIGLGYDSHRFEAGRRLVLGGVEFPGETGLKGHSDADVLIHAVIDAILGAAALGDIGARFPDTDARWRGADSSALVHNRNIFVLLSHTYLTILYKGCFNAASQTPALCL